MHKENISTQFLLPSFYYPAEKYIYNIIESIFL